MGPENLFVGPCNRKVSGVNSARIERIFVADGPTAEGRECVNAAKGTFSGPTKKKMVRELGPNKKATKKQKKRKNRECELETLVPK